MVSAPVALVSGALGQDGSYMCELLLAKGYRVVGLDRPADGPASVPGEAAERFEYRAADLTDSASLTALIRTLQPREVYNFAALSHVGQSFERPVDVLQVNAEAVVVILEALRRHCPEARFFGAASAEVFGARSGPADESTPINPVSPYGASKAYALQMTRIYRQAFKLHASSGILFNHESERRPAAFVTRKITAAMARIAQGRQAQLELGNVAAQRDWGYAPDYVEAAWRMLQADNGDDYVVATGTPRRVSDFVDAAAQAVGLTLTWSGQGVETVARDQHGVVRVVVNPDFYRPIDLDVLYGDASKARRTLGWAPTVAFEALVKRMVEHDLSASVPSDV